MEVNMKKISVIFLLTMIFQYPVYTQLDSIQCTIGVAHGSATQDGRPIVWQTMDWDYPNWEVRYTTAFDYKFVSTYDDYYYLYPAMGVNEHGLAAVRSLTFDLTPATSGHNAYQTMLNALGKCRTIDEFQAYLDTTNIIGRTHTCNIAMIDSTGAAAIFEVGGNEYWRFDAVDDTNGFIIRTNFTLNGGGNAGLQRYNRSSTLISDFRSGDSLSHRSLIRYHMRDFSDSYSQPYSIPYPNQISPSVPFGYFPAHLSICNSISVSSVIIHGVLAYEKPELSTMWAILGQPAAGICCPYWPVGETPSYASHSNGGITAPLCDVAQDIRELLFDWSSVSYINSYRLRDSIGGGLWPCTFPTENLILDNAELLLDEWRNLDSIPINEMLATENYLSEMAYNSLLSCHDNLVSTDDLFVYDEFKIIPNPIKSKASAEYYLVQPSKVLLKIFDLSGKEVVNLNGGFQSPGKQNLIFNTERLKPGIYFCTLKTNPACAGQTKKIIKTK